MAIASPPDTLIHTGRSRSLGLCLVVSALILVSACTLQESNKSQQLVHSTSFEGRALGQSFVATHDYLSAIEVQAVWETQTTSAEHLATLLLWKVESPPTLVRQVSLGAGNLEIDGSYTRIAFAPIADASSSEFMFRLEAESSRTITLWGTSYDSYEVGHRLVGQQPSQGDLAFRALYRSPPWQGLAEGWETLLKYSHIVLASAVLFGIGGALVVAVLRRHFDLDLASALSLGIGSGPLVILMVAYGVVAAGAQISRMLTLVVLAVLGILTILTWRNWKHEFDARTVLVPLCLALFVTVIGLLRLSYAYELTTPSYADAVEHFRIAQDMANPQSPPTAYFGFDQLRSRYYHLGFHALASWVAALAEADLIATITILGQLLQVVAVVSVYFPLRQLTGNVWVGLIGVALVGFGWSMPAYASNWGKFAALAAISTLPVVIGLAHIGMQQRARSRWMILGITLLLALAVSLAHSRAAIIFVTALICAYLAGIATQRSERLIGLGVACAIILIVLALVATVPAFETTSKALRLSSLATIVSRYKEAHGGLSSLIVGIAVIFALAAYRRLALAGLLFILSILMLTIGPIRFIPSGFLIDRTFGQLSTYLPLTYLGSLGLGSAIRTATTNPPNMSFVRNLAITGVLSALLLNGFFRQSFAPSGCCQISQADDLIMGSRAKTTLSGDTLTLIASARWSPDFVAGIDGGAWFGALSGHRTLPWLFYQNPIDPSFYEQICTSGATHIYIGAQSISFRRDELDAYPELFAPEIALPKAALYRVTGCSGV